MKLITTSLTPPERLEEMLTTLGEGETGFSGSSYIVKNLSMSDYLQECIDMSQGINLPKGFVPQTTFWMLVNDKVIGTIRVRHYLNDFLRTMGGHIGYYVKPSARGNGYAKQALELALPELAKLGEDKALITVNPENHASIKTVLSCGGVYTETFTNDTGDKFNHYWVDLSKIELPKDTNIYVTNVMQHVAEVRSNLKAVTENLSTRGELHDKSKLEEPEKSIFINAIPKFKATTYGTQEYEDDKALISDALSHHYANNSHHPEHYDTGIEGMSLFDIIEMLCDWKAANRRSENGDINRSLDIAKEKFAISDQLYKILDNTIKELEWK